MDITNMTKIRAIEQHNAVIYRVGQNEKGRNDKHCWCACHSRNTKSTTA